MRLPPGTGAVIEPWSKEDGSYTKKDGYEDLPPVVTNLSDLKATNRTQVLKEAVRRASENGFFDGCKIKNIIVIVGDGMGESHLKGSRNYYGPLFMDEFPLYRSARTECLFHQPGSDARIVPDSSAAGTAIFCGELTRYGYIGLDKDEKPIKNISEYAREKGMYIGIVTNDHIGDSTPASALVHETAREHEDLIYRLEFEFAPDLLIGHDAGIRKYVESPEGVEKGMKGYEAFPLMCEGEKACGYKNKAVSFWGGNCVQYSSDTPAGFNLGNNKEVPNFAEMVSFTLSDLDHKAKANGDCGFFCMIENTCCDGWGHAQQVPQIFTEVQCFDEGVAVAAKFVLENPDTLLVITADHENADLRFRDGWESDINRVISMTSSHSAQPVPVIAFGAGASLRFEKRSDGVTEESFKTGRDIIWLFNNYRV